MRPVGLKIGLLCSATDLQANRVSRAHTCQLPGAPPPPPRLPPCWQVLREDSWVVVPIESSREPGGTLEGTRLTLVKVRG